MARVAVVYHSGYGHTAVIAERIARGASGVVGVDVALIAAAELGGPSNGKLGGRWEALHAADGILFGCPTYMGSVSAELKRVFECTGKVWSKQLWRDKLAGGFTNGSAASGDKLGALQGMFLFAMQHGMIWVSQGIEQTGHGEGDLNRMGSSMGLMAQSRDASPEVTPPEGDRRTAEVFGARFAEVTLRMVRGRLG